MAPISVLYVDDDVTLLDICKIFLEDGGKFKIDTSESAKDALKKMSSNTYDAILSDYQMPKMDGIQFLIEIRKRFGSIPFILFTGRGREEVVIQALNSGADFYLQKGGDPESQFAELSNKITYAISRRRAEAAKQESDASLDLALRSAEMGVWHWDIIEGKRYFDDTTCHLLGIDPSVFTGSAEEFFKVVHPEDHQILKDSLNRTIEQDVLYEPVYRVIHPDGSFRFVAARGRLVKNAAGKPERINGIIWDITERKQTEEELHVLTDRLFLATRAGGVGIWDYDVVHNTLVWDDQMFALYGITREQFGGAYEAWQAGLHPDDRTLGDEEFQKALRGEKDFNTEFRVLWADGSTHYIRALAIVQRDSDSKPLRVIGTNWDITERKQMGEQLDMERTFIDAIFNSAPGMIYLYNTDGQLVQWNKNHERMTGYSAEELSHMHLLDWYKGDAESQAAVTEGIRTTIEKGFGYAEANLQKKDGTRIPMYFTASPLLINGQQYFTGIGIDITERKRAEEALLKRNEELHGAYEQIQATEEELRGNLDELSRQEQGLRRSEEKYRSLYIHMIEGAALHQLTFTDQGIPDDYIILETNPAFEKQLGISRNDVIGKTSREAYGVSEPPYLETYARVALTGKPEVFETYFQPLDKYFSISVYCPEKGKFATIFEDITERKRADEVLKESEAKFRFLSESSPDYIMRYDRQCRHTYMNQAGLRVSGLTADQLIGKTHREAGYDEDLSRMWEEKITGVFETGKPSRTQFEWGSAEGRVVIDWLLTPELADDGSVRSVLGVSRDITRLKQAEEGLESAQQKLKEVHHLAHIGTWDWVVDTDTVTWSDELYEIAGWDPAKPAPTYAQHPCCYTPSSWERLDTAVKKALTTGEPYNLELELVRPDGSTRWTNAFGGRMTDASGKCIGLHGTMQDITERKRAEEKLKESEVLLAEAQRIAHMGSWSWDFTTNKVAWSDEMYRIFGISPDIYDGTPEMALNVVHPDDRERFIQNMEDIMSRGVWNPLEYRVIHSDRSIHIVYANGVVEFDNAGNPVRSTGTVQDITERKLAEQELQKSRSEYVHLLENIHDIYYRSDTEGRLVLASTSWAKKLGYDDLTECLGKNIADTFYADPRDRKRFLDEVYKNGYVSDYEVNLKKKDGTTLPVAVSSYLYFDKAGTILGIEGTWRDITERKKMENALRESEKNYSLILENANDAIFLHEILPDGRPGKYALVNTIACQRLGYTHDELLQMSVSDVASPRHIPNIPELAKKLHQDGYATFEGIHRRKDGTEFPVENSTHIFEMGGRKVAITFSRDITDRKQIEEALKKSEEKYRNVIEVQTELICRFRPDGTHIFVNEAYCRYFGVKREDLLGHRFIPCIPDGDREFLKQFFASLTPDHPSGDIRHRIIMPDGNVRWQRWSDLAIFDSEGHITEYQSVGRDITDMKKAEEALAESEEKYRTLVEKANEAIIIVQDEHFVFANSKMSELLGVPKEDFIGKSIIDFIWPDDRKMVMEKYRRRMNGEAQSDAYDFRIVGKEGRLRWVFLQAALIQWNGKPATLNILTDITERKQADEAIRLMNKKLNILSSITRHDLKNQLMALKSYLAISKRVFGDPAKTSEINAKEEEVIKNIERQIDFTKEYEDIGVKAPIWQNCHTLVEHASKQISFGQIIVKNNVPKCTEMFADSLVVKVFYNLMENAIRHGGKVTTIRFFTEERDGANIIVCEDDGDGIIPGEKEAIFDRGFGRNTGLGLFLAREILDITGIKISETGEPGIGARFEIAVPKGAFRLSDENTIC